MLSIEGSTDNVWLVSDEQDARGYAPTAVEVAIFGPEGVLGDYNAHIRNLKSMLVGDQPYPLDGEITTAELEQRLRYVLSERAAYLAGRRVAMFHQYESEFVLQMAA